MQIPNSVDYAGIRQAAIDTVRYIRNDDNRAESAMKVFLDKGAASPSYADMARNNAYYVNGDVMLGKVNGGECSSKYAFNKIIKTPKAFQELTKLLPKELDIFESNYKELYPRTYLKRKIISSLVCERYGEHINVSKNKIIKKLFNMFLK